MTDEEIHNIYLHMSGKAEGLVEATGTADFPVLFARAILEYKGLTKDVQNMASKSTYKEQLKTKDELVSCAECGADGGHALYCVACAEKFVKREWVGLTKEDMPDGENPMFDHKYFIAGMVYANNTLLEKNT